MARIRTIKPEFWTDEKVVALSPFARLLFIGLWNFVDDEGRAPLSIGRLKMQILPADPVEVSELLGEIRRASLIDVYQVDGKEYFQVSGFARHQKVDKRTASKHPPPIRSADFPRVVQTEGIKEGIKEKKDGASAPKNLDDDGELFQRGAEILGKENRSLVALLKKSLNGNVRQTRTALELAAKKSDPREYVGAVIRGENRANITARAEFENPLAGII